AVVAARRHRGALVLVLALAAWSGLLALLLWRDPHAANDGAVLLAKSTFADGNAYVPNLFIRTWGDGAPGLAFRNAMWFVLPALVAFGVARASRGAADGNPVRVLVTVVVVTLIAGFALERWPSPYRTPRFADALSLAGGATAFVAGGAQGDDESLRVGS